MALSRFPPEQSQPRSGGENVPDRALRLPDISRDVSGQIPSQWPDTNHAHQPSADRLTLSWGRNRSGFLLSEQTKAGMVVSVPAGFLMLRPPLAILSP